MKRVLILIVTLLFGLTLAACDNFTQVQEFSREYCEQNPNEEICQLDAIDNLTEAEILQLFNGVLENYNNAEYANFCDEYFSVANPTLLDDCREATTNLVPDGFEGFSEITYNADASNNYYVITGITLDGLHEIEFRIQVVLEDGGYLISYWQFTSTPIQVECAAGEILENGECVPEPVVCSDGYTLVDGLCVEDTVTECPTGQELVDGVCLPIDPLEITYEDAKEFLQNFIDMYLDPAIDSQDFCYEYFIMDPEGCIEDREEGHTSGAYISLDEVLDLGEGIFGAQMTFYDVAGGEGRPQYQKFLLTRDAAGDILIEFIENRVPIDVAAAFFTDLLMDFQDPNIPIEEIANNYFMGEIPEDIAEDRDKVLQEGVTYVVTGWYENEYGEYVLQFTVTFPDGSEEIEVPFMVYEYQPGMYVIDVRDNDGYNPDEEAYIYELIESYLDPNVDSQTWCDTYFGPEAEMDCAEDRDETLALPDAYINILFMDWRDGKLFFGLEMFDGTEYAYPEMSVEFIYDDYGIWYVRFHEDHYDHEQVTFIEELVATYMDPNWDSQSWCDHFFGPDQEGSCAMDRDGDLANTDFYVALQWIEYHDGMMRVGIEMDDGVEHKYEEMFVEFIYDDFGIQYVRFHPGQMVDPAQEEYIHEMFESYKDPNMDSQTWCDTYFGPEQESSCAVDRDEALQNSAFYVNLQWMDFYDGMLRIGIEMGDGTEHKYEELFVEFVYDEFGIQYVRFHPGYMVDPEHENFIHMLVNDFNDFSLLSEDICAFYFDGEDHINGCIQKREEMILVDGMLMLEYIHGGEYGVELGFRWFMGTDEYVEDVLAHFYYNEFNELKVQFEGRHHYQFDWNEAEAILDEIIFDFNDQTLSDADFCYKWFPHMDATMCFLERERFMGQNFNAFKEWMDYHDHGFRVGLRVQLPDTSEEYYYEFIFSPYYDENGELQIHWWYDHHGYNHDDALFKVQGFFNDALDNAYTDDAFFNMYSRGDWQQFIDVRNHLIGLNITDWQITRFDFDGYNAYIEVELWDGTNTSWFEYFHIEFYDDMDGFWMNIYFSEPHVMFPEHEARLHLEWHINLFNDRAVSDDDACMYMPRIFEDCHWYRQEMFAQNLDLILLDFWPEYGNQFGANIEFTDFANGTSYIKYFSFHFWYHSDSTIGMELNQPMPPHRWATFDEAQDLWNQWVTDYQDPNMSEEDFANKWFFGHHHEDFFQGRRDSMANGDTYVQIDFINDGMMGPDAYRFIIEHHKNGQVMVQEDYVMFRIFDDGKFQIEFMDRGPIVDHVTATQFMDAFFFDLRDGILSTSDICGTYFPYEAEGNCIYIVDNIFRNHSDYSWFYFDVFNDHYDMGVDFYDTEGYMVHTAYFFVFFMHGPNGELFFDLQEHPGHHHFEHQWFFDYMNNFQPMIDDFITDATTISQLCDMYFYNDPLCGEFEQFFTPELSSAYVLGFWWEDDYDATTIEFYTDVYFEYTDGTYILIEYQVFFETDANNVMHATLQEVGRFASAPATAILQDDNVTLAVLAEFAIDYSDPNVDAIGMCNVYFNDNMMDVGCLEGRDEFLQLGGIAVFLYMDIYQDENGVPYYEAFFELTENGVVETVNAQVRVYQLEDGRYFIEFMDMYYEDDFINYDMFYTRIYEFIAAYNDPANTDEYICTEFYDLPAGDTSCEPDRQTMLSQGSMLVLNMMNEDYWIDDQPTFIIELEYVNNDTSLNLAYTVQYLPFYDMDGNIVFTHAPPMP